MERSNLFVRGYPCQGSTAGIAAHLFLIGALADYRKRYSCSNNTLLPSPASYHGYEEIVTAYSVGGVSAARKPTFSGLPLRAVAGYGHRWAVDRAIAGT